MLRQELKSAFVTIWPLSFTAAALWATTAAYEVQWFDDLHAAKMGAVVLMLAVHVFAPFWAGTRSNWWSAGVAQVMLVGVNDYFWLQLALEASRDAVRVSKCGTGGAFLVLGTMVGFLVYVPLALVNARAVHRKLQE